MVIEALLGEYANSQEDRKKQIIEQITNLVQQEFHQRHSAQEQELKALEQQLAAKKNAFDKREAIKEKIVSDRVASLIQKAEGTGWEPLGPSMIPSTIPPNWTPVPVTPLVPMPLYPSPPGVLPGLIPPVPPLPANSNGFPTPDANYPKARVSYEDFKELVAEVESHRRERILSLDQFLAMSKQPNVLILDTRSDFRYDRIHIQGAKHLSFTDFTQTNLANVIPSLETTVLIYCNNNFDGNQVDFASKSAPPRPRGNRAMESQVAAQNKPVQLALNVPTYINLYGYGYRNVYELGELVKVSDPRIQFEGSWLASSRVSVISPKSPFGNQSQRSFHIWLFATPPDGGGIFDGIDVIDKVDGIYSGQN
jgi:rhodanese-related sulfurtransferase